MINGMFNALSGLVASAERLQNIANNSGNLKDLSLGMNKVTVGDKRESRSEVDSTETSKVNISKDMVNQMATQAAFTANAQLTVIADETIGIILDTKS